MLEEFDGGEEIVGALIVAGGDAMGLLELAEEALDQITIAVQERAEGEALSAIVPGRDVGDGVSWLEWPWCRSP